VNVDRGSAYVSVFADCYCQDEDDRVEDDGHNEENDADE
jgi:hypothetical protein